MNIPIFLYYELSNFYHNHRHLVKSIDGDQFRGQIFAKDGKPLAPAHSCAPFSLGKETCSITWLWSTDENGMYYFPCGALANSMFTDRFVLQTETGYDVQLKEKGIAVSYSTPYKFSNPRDVTPANHYYERAFYKAFIMPKDWNKEIWDEWWKSGGMENERWQNWMLPSSKPTFRKLYAIIDSAPRGCTDGTLCKGNYIMHIDYTCDDSSQAYLTLFLHQHSNNFHNAGYDVTGVGNKAFILTTTSFMGTSNRFIPLFTSGLGLFYALCGFQLLRIVDFRNHFHQQDHHSITAEQKPDEVKGHTTSKFQDEIPNKHAPEKIRKYSDTNIGFKITSPTPPDVSNSSSNHAECLAANIRQHY
ncbi:Cell cycle control protein 50A [Orchesella cincta]|uniref:Cell cycle control protein 50A n=1 Tax=Orchesella cincta TaxID=48709 RepID=A0A1D2MTW0_ORCCI|nr:Cell cycle control protein 50A [Orchesella cincta]